MDELCNFSGINNISYEGKDKEEDEDDFQRALSPKPIFHKIIKFLLNIKILIK